MREIPFRRRDVQETTGLPDSGSKDWHERHLDLWNLYHLTKRCAGGDLASFRRALAEDPDPRNRRAAAECLGVLGTASEATALRTALEDPDPFVRGAAAVALGRLRDLGSLDSLKTAIEKVSVHPLEREHLFISLFMLADREAEREMMDRLASPSPAVRARAVLLVGQAGRREYLPVLLKFLDDASETGEVEHRCAPEEACGKRVRKVRDAAVEALAALSGEPLSCDPWATEAEQADALESIRDRFH